MLLRMIPTGLGMTARTSFDDKTSGAHSLYFHTSPRGAG